MLYKRTTNDHRNGQLKNKDKLFREQGWRSGKSTRLPPMWPGFESWRRRHAWFKFVVGSLPCSERFLSGYSGFTPPLKPTLPNSNSIWNARTHELLSAPWVNTLQFNTKIHFNDLAEAIEAAVTPEWIVIHTLFLQFDWSGDHNVTLTCSPMTNHEKLLVTAGC